MRKLAIVGNIGVIGLLATLVGCTPTPKQRSWRLSNNSTWDDHLGAQYYTLAGVQSLRDEALADLSDVTIYGYLTGLAFYLWEVQPLLEARDRAARDPEYKYEPPPEIATLDPAALIAEAEVVLAEYEAAAGYRPYLWQVLAFARGDCQAVSAEAAIDMSCQSDNFSSGFEYPKAVCGDVKTVCRETLNLMVDPDEMFYLLKSCARDMTKGTDTPLEEALATWLSPEELEFYREVKAKLDQRGAVALAQVNQARADAREENERRIEEYNEASARHAAEAPAVDRHSQIGALDPADRPPPPPSLITSVGMQTGVDPDGRRLSLQKVAVGVVNGCDKPVDVKVVDTGETHTVKPGKRIDLVIRRCGGLQIGNDRNTVNEYVSRPAVLNVKSNCRNSDKVYVRPEPPAG
ncbi:MAG: hypothetical protein R6X02_23160 [Enhygromyxa sp.]